MKKISCIVVDDEKDSRETLKGYLEKYCTEVTLIKECKDIMEAEKAIKQYQPEIVFLDIEMPKGNAFDLLERFENIKFEVIFVTAFSQYAIQAFNLSAAHYLLKPVNIEELEQAVHKVIHRIKNKLEHENLSVLLSNINELKIQEKKLALPLMEGFEIVKISDVSYCAADDNFSVFHFSDNRKQMICRPLKFYESTLRKFGFCRIHRSYLINLHYLKRYNKGKGGSVVMASGEILPVSSSRKADLTELIDAWINA